MTWHNIWDMVIFLSVSVFFLILKVLYKMVLAHQKLDRAIKALNIKLAVHFNAMVALLLLVL